MQGPARKPAQMQEDQSLNNWGGDDDTQQHHSRRAWIASPTPAHYMLHAKWNCRSSRTFTQRWHQRRNVVTWAFSVAQLWFYSIHGRPFVSWQHQIIGAVWAAWTLPHRGINGIILYSLVTADFLFDQHLNRIVWHSHTFLPGWCRVVKWRGGLGFLFVGDNQQQRCFSSVRAVCSISSSYIHEFPLLGWIPAGRLCYQ